MQWLANYFITCREVQPAQTNSNSQSTDKKITRYKGNKHKVASPQRKSKRNLHSSSGSNSSAPKSTPIQKKETLPTVNEPDTESDEVHSLPSVLPSSMFVKETSSSRHRSSHHNSQHRKTTQKSKKLHQQKQFLRSSPSSSSSTSNKTTNNNTALIVPINRSDSNQNCDNHNKPSSENTNEEQKSMVSSDFKTATCTNKNDIHVEATTQSTKISRKELKTTPLWVKTVPIELFYRIGREIGRGGFSVVKEAFVLETGEKRAVKLIDKSRAFDFESAEKQRRALDKLWREIDIMRRVNHKNILKLFDVFDSEEFIYIVTEFVSGGELFDQIVQTGGLPESRAAPIIKQIVSAVRHLHTLNIVHRDVKPENILLTDDEHTQVKLCDFGLANVLYEDTLLETACGSAEYVAPEVLQCKPYDNAVDLWSIGVTTYIVLSSNFPFYAKSDHQLFEKIIRVEYDFNGAEWEDVSEEGAASLFSEAFHLPLSRLFFSSLSHFHSHSHSHLSLAKDFIRRLLVADPRQRMTTEQCLQHPWLAKAVDY